MSKAKSRQRTDAPVNFWHRALDPIDFGEEEFRLTALRGKDKKPIQLDPYMESFAWSEDDKHVLTGSVNVRRQEITNFALKTGMEIRCEVSKKGQNHYTELWRLRVAEPEYQIAGGEYTYQLQDDLVRLGQGQDDFKYRKDKAHPHGWLPHEVIADICKRYGVPVGRLPVMKHRIKKMTKTGVSALSVIQQVLRYERIDTGSRFFIRWVNGALSVLPFQRSNELLRMSGTIIDGTVTESLKDNFATVLHVTATVDQGKKKDSKGHKRHKKKKISVVVQTKNGVETFGYIRRKITAPHAESTADARKWGLRELARIAKPKQELTFTHPGIARLRRGAALRLTIPEANIQQQIVYVTSVNHSVAPGDYSMEVTIEFDDPFINKTKEADKKARCAKARKHHRRAPKGCSGTTAKTPQPKKARQRGNK